MSWRKSGRSWGTRGSGRNICASFWTAKERCSGRRILTLVTRISNRGSYKKISRKAAKVPAKENQGGRPRLAGEGGNFVTIQDQKGQGHGQGDWCGVFC